MLEVADRKRIFRYAVSQFFIHSVVFITLLMVLRYAKETALECGTDIYKYLYICMAYFGFCAFRQLVIVVIVSFAKHPQKTSDLANILFIGFDAIFISALTMWGTMIQFDEGAKDCRDTSDNWVLMMYIMNLGCLLYGWAYFILLCCGLTSLPLIAIFWCFYRKQMNNMRGEMGVDHDQQRVRSGNTATARTAEIEADREFNEIIKSLTT